MNPRSTPSDEVTRSPTVTVVQDYLCARAGGERVVAAMARGIPNVRLFAGLYDPPSTFPEFSTMDVRTLPINRIPMLRHDHRRALPFLALSFKRTTIEADICLCSTSGWSHGVRTTGRKIAYWHSPAKWLYQRERYAAAGSNLGRAALRILSRRLVDWDMQAVRTVDRHLCNSTFIASELMRIYGVTAQVIPPPHGMTSGAARTMVRGLEPGFLLSINRLLPYKNVEAVVRAVGSLAGERLVLVGKGPLERRLRGVAGDSVVLLHDIDDSTLRWLYANCSGLVSASREDFGITPLEAATFGKPAAVLRYGGFIDTVVEGRTGVFFDEPNEVSVAGAILRLHERSWDTSVIASHAMRFGEAQFITELRGIIADEYSRQPMPRARRI